MTRYAPYGGADPALPGPLIAATTSLRDHLINPELYDQQITARACYQLNPKDGPDADGYQRFSCPATGRHPGLTCPLPDDAGGFRVCGEVVT